MCMIIYKPVGVDFPGDGLFNHILANNPHGTGILCNQTVKKLARETYPEDFINYSKSDAVMVHARIATRGSICSKNIHPFSDKRLPGYWFAHNGTMGYSISKDMTDSEYFYKHHLVPWLLEHSFTELGKLKHDMRASGSRFILWSGKNDEVPFFRGEWYYLKGCLFSHYVPGGKQIGIYDRWWTINTNKS